MATLETKIDAKKKGSAHAHYQITGVSCNQKCFVSLIKLFIDISLE